MTLGVRLTATALQHIEDARAWWKVNRPTSPELFVNELAVHLERISHNPGTGAIYDRIGGPTETRRILLRRTGYHLYYSVENEIVVRAVWHAMRGRAPRLR